MFFEVHLKQPSQKLQTKRMFLGNGNKKLLLSDDSVDHIAKWVELIGIDECELVLEEDKIPERHVEVDGRPEGAEVRLVVIISMGVNPEEPPAVICGQFSGVQNSAIIDSC
jgi:hypothetical protein